MKLAEFLELPKIASFFPLVYSNGARWTDMRAECSSCNARIPEELLRGQVGSPFRDVFVISALGYCDGCNRLTPVEYRLHGDMAMTGKNRSGDWVRWTAQYTQPAWLRALRKWWRS